MIRNKLCSKCNILLTKENSYLSDRRKNRSICKQCRKQKTKDWLKKHPLNKKQYNIRNRKYYKSLKRRIMELLGNKCNNCRIGDFRVLQIDHINNNGYEERKKIGNNGGGITQYLYIFKKLKSGSNDYQLLCANCNQIKKYEYNKSRLLDNIQKKNTLKVNK